MALHKDLPIYKTAYDLLTNAIKITAKLLRGKAVNQQLTKTHKGN